MDPNENSDSLDQQVDSIFRKRSKTRFLTALVAAGSFLMSTLTGCFAKDVRAMGLPDDFRPRAEAYKNSLLGIAEAMGLYDSETSIYDAARVKTEAERQLEPDPDPESVTGYLNLTDYSNVDQLLATRYALGKVIEQNEAYISTNESSTDPAVSGEIDRRRTENSDLRSLREKHVEALAMYNEIGAADPGRSDSDRMRCSLALGLMEYGRNTKEGRRNWQAIAGDREEAWGAYEIGDDADHAFVGERYFEDFESAFNARKGRKKRNGIIALISSLGGLLIYGLASQDGGNGGAGDIGGETGAPGGR